MTAETHSTARTHAIPEGAVAARRERDPALEPDIKNPIILSIESLSLWYGSKKALDDRFPFAHLERKFMHLGFHIFDVGFQSPNVEATTPLVFATALLLIFVVTVMNLLAISLRNHLRRKYAGSAV